MPNRVCCWVAFTTLSLVACLPLTAQESSQHDWYAPLTTFNYPQFRMGKLVTVAEIDSASSLLLTG